jgi:two-component system, NarL family, sensor histidine kinase UhpB
MDLQARVLDQTSDRVCITDLDGVIRYVNEAECRALKRSRRELIGRHVSVFGEDAELGATQREVIDSTLANGRWRGEVVNFASNGAQSMVDLRTFLVQSASDKAIAICGIGTDITERKESEAELLQSRMELRDLYLQMQNAREEERQRISREIHDELGQNITALQINLAWLKKRTDPVRPDLLDKLDAMNRIAESTLATVRRVSAELRPGILDALGLTATVNWLVRDFEKRSEILCSLLIEPEEIEVEQALAIDVFRVLQEALTNVARHAQASALQVTLRQTEGMLELEVVDDGIGISEEKISRPGSLGILGIRERLMAHGGGITLRRLPGKGTRVSAAIPTQGKEVLK